MAAGAPWTRALVANTSEFIKEVEVNIMWQRKILAKIQAMGRTTFNHSGKDTDWKVRYRRAPMIAFADADTITFAKQDRYKTANQDWRSYYNADSLSKFEQLENKGPEGIVKYYDQLMPMLEEDIEEQFADQVYVDGYATGNEKKIHGLESMFGADLSAVAGRGGFALPDDDYAGLSTEPGDYNGSWTGTWPVGKGDPHYDFWSPILVNYTDPSSWMATTKTFANTCIEALRAGITRSRMLKSKKGQLDTIILELGMYDDLKNAYEYAQELEVFRGDPYSLLSLGFTDVMNFDGTEVTTEYGLPLYTGYGLNFNQMDLMSLQPQLFSSNGPYFDEESVNWRYFVDFYGNMRFNPRGQMKLYAWGANA